MEKKYYTLEEASTHWDNTIEQCGNELRARISQHNDNTLHYEKINLTR